MRACGIQWESKIEMVLWRFTYVCEEKRNFTLTWVTILSTMHRGEERHVVVLNLLTVAQCAHEAFNFCYVTTPQQVKSSAMRALGPYYI